MDLLITYVQSKTKLLIDSDGSRYNRKSGWVCIIANEDGDEIISGYNPDFEDISQINSHRLEIFETLAVLLFLREYRRFFKIEMQSEIIYYCDNKEVIRKLQNTSEDKSYYSEDYKAKDSDAILKIQSYFLCNFKMKDVRGHQDKWVRKEKLTITEKLNIKSDRIIGDKGSILKKINI